MNTVAIMLTVALGVSNALVTITLLRSKSLTRSQLIGQSLIVWLLPVVGVIVVWLVLKEASQPFRSRSNEANEYTEYTASNYESHHHGGSGHDN